MLGDNLYLENIHEYVQDEEKIVTYKFLSRKLDVPVNAAKRMLHAYAAQCKDNDPIHVTYFVSGIVGSNGNSHHEVCLVNEPSLEETKQRFNQLFSVHVYSVQKAYLKDSGVLFAADYDVTKEHIGDYSKWSTIDYPVSAKVPVRKPPGGQVTTQVTVSKLPKLSHHVKQEKEEVSEHLAPVETKSTTEEPGNTECEQPAAKKNASKGKPKAQHGKGTVTSLFAKQAQKGNGENLKEPVKVKVEPCNHSKDETAKTTVVHITSPRKSPHKSPAKRGRPTKIKEPASKKLTGLFKGLGDSDIEDSQSDEEPPKSKTVSTNKQQKGKKKDVSKGAAGSTTGAIEQRKSEDRQQRKRKRVQELSSDEEEPEEHDSRRTEEENDSAGRKVKKRKRYKKMVTKMFMNEEGEMVTERDWEMVSTDDSEGEEKEEVKNKPAESQTKTEKHSPTKQTKQSSLRSFFKR